MSDLGSEGYQPRSVERSGGLERVRRWKESILKDFQEVANSPEEQREDKATEIAHVWAVRQTNWEFLSLRDPKTHALSRVAAEEILAREMRLETKHGDGVGVAMLDLDDYKDVIQPGMKKSPEEVVMTEMRGDEGILAYVNLIEDFIKEHEFDSELNTKNIKLFRMGGEEMLLIMPNIKDEENLKRILEGIRVKIEAELAEKAGIEEFKKDRGGKQTVSIGGIVVKKVADIKAVFNAADEALYKAKRAGKNRVEIISFLEGDESLLEEESKWNARMAVLENRPGRIEELVKKYTQEILDNQENEDYASKLAENFDIMEQNVVCDALTATYHRGAGAQMIQEVMDLEGDHGHRVGLALFNIDDFSGVNNTFSHEVGDKVLQEFVKITSEILEDLDEDGFQVRWKPGGEFLVSVAHSIDIENIARVANEIGVRVGRDLGNRVGIGRKVSVSAGVCLSGSKIQDAVLQLIRLEQKAKDEGRNCMAVTDGESDEIVMFS